VKTKLSPARESRDQAELAIAETQLIQAEERSMRNGNFAQLLGS